MNAHHRHGLIALLFAPLLLLAGCSGGVEVGSGGGLLGLIVLGLVIWALVDIIQSRRDNGEKILWAVIILLVPVIGLILYAVMGRK